MDSKELGKLVVRNFLWESLKSLLIVMTATGVFLTLSWMASLL